MSARSLVVGAAIALLAATVCPFSSPFQPGAAIAGPDHHESLTVERIFDGSLVKRIPRGVKWIGDAEGVTYFDNVDHEGESVKALVMREVPSGKQRVLCIPEYVPVPEDLREGDDTTFSFSTYEWSEDGKRGVLIFKGDLFLLDVKSGRVDRLTQTDGDEKDPQFSPDGRMLAYNRDNDLYTLNIDSREETRLTDTGSKSILNGVLDWVYMEELFTRGDVQAFWWSPDSERIAFLEIRESPVPTFPLVDWIPTQPTYELQHYPKAGDPNPVVRVGMVQAHGGEITWADTDTSDDSYIARVYWLGDSRGVALEKLNRAQDRLTVYFANARSGKLEQVLEETDDTWVNVTYLRHYYKEKRLFVWGSERDGHSHLYLYNLDGSLERQLTRGDWEVTELNGVNEKKGRIYFTANESDVRERQLYEVTEKGKMRRITSEAGTHDVTLSPDYKYYVDSYSTATRPPVLAVYNMDGKKLFEIDDALTDELRIMERPKPEFITVQANGISYNCMITKPLDLDESQPHPAIVYVYGGPHAQIVRDAWSRHHLWHSMMAEKGYVVFSLDNRGSFGRGKAWEDHILKDMGNYELVDQVAGVDYLKSLPYVDGSRIGIWGWSYGGYMTLMALFKAADVFHAGVSVAPVTDWKLYDSIYTERYMKRPVDNPSGYEDASPANFVSNFQGKLLVIHGDADDNVHAQNTFRLTRELIDAGKDFDLMIYPQKLHGISGKADRTHLYKKMTSFFDRHLLEGERSEPMHP